VNAPTRARMLARAARLPRDGTRSQSALRRALLTTARGRLPAEERAWIERIRARRAEVAAQGAADYAASGEADEIAGYLAASAEPWSVPALFGELMLRLVRELAPRSCLELGTGFGASALYVGAALELNGAGRLVTLDREERLRPVARRGFEQLGIAARVEQVTGEIDSTLGRALEGAAPVEWALVDAEHTEEATVRHFQALRPGLAPDAVVLVDDINLSPGMRRAWGRIRSDAVAAFTLDLHRLGVVIVADA
jgi:predicted O-methyltransferase YrrM